jgi:hypothetical protein
MFVFAKGRTFNNMLYARYVHLTKAKPILERQNHPLSLERMLHRDYDGKGSVAKKMAVILEVLGTKTN